jgi:hypothetical protein
VPAQQVALRPFCPWSSFTWEHCRLGSSRFDFAYEQRDGRLVGEIVNRNDRAFDGVIELTLPEGARLSECRANGVPAEKIEHTHRYGRQAIRVSRAIAPGDALCLEVHYAAATDSERAQ